MATSQGKGYGTQSIQTFVVDLDTQNDLIMNFKDSVCFSKTRIT